MGRHVPPRLGTRQYQFALTKKPKYVLMIRFCMRVVVDILHLVFCLDRKSISEVLFLGGYPFRLYGKTYLRITKEVRWVPVQIRRFLILGNSFFVFGTVLVRWLKKHVHKSKGKNIKRIYYRYVLLYV